MMDLVKEIKKKYLEIFYSCRSVKYFTRILFGLNSPKYINDKQFFLDYTVLSEYGYLIIQMNITC